MDQRSSHLYGYDAQSEKQHHSSHATSSAFSESANANEDWTKISDLAERRRIQNRIAQRNYRKKLKKRLEDLERRANSGSPEEDDEPELEDSYEVKHDPIKHSVSSINNLNNVANRRKSTSRKISSPMTYQDEKTMFSRQHLRQLSTSPPPFSYPSYGSSSYDMPATPSYTHNTQIPPHYASSSSSQYHNYLPTLDPRYVSQYSTKPAAIKQEFYGDDEMSPFSMSYASMAGIDIPYAGGYQEQPLIHTPELSDTYEPSSAGSPGEYASEHDFSMHLFAMPLTPPFQPFER